MSEKRKDIAVCIAPEVHAFVESLEQRVGDRTNGALLVTCWDTARGSAFNITVRDGLSLEQQVQILQAMRVMTDQAILTALKVVQDRITQERTQN